MREPTEYAGFARYSQDFESELERYPKPLLSPHAILPVSALAQEMTSPRCERLIARQSTQSLPMRESTTGSGTLTYGA